MYIFVLVINKTQSCDFRFTIYSEKTRGLRKTGETCVSSFLFLLHAISADNRGTEIREAKFKQMRSVGQVLSESENDILFESSIM